MRSLRRLPSRSFSVARLALFSAVFVAALILSSKAYAQARTFYLERLEIGGSPNDGIAVWRPRMKDRTVFYGQFALGYSLHPLRGDTVLAYPHTRDPSTVPNPIDHRLTNYLSAGFEILERASLGITVPVVLYQGGNDPCSAALVTGCEHTSPNTAGMSDLRIDGRVIAYRTDNRKFHLGFGASLYPPAGGDISFTSDRETHFAMRALTEYDFRTVIVSLNAGVHFRHEFGNNDLRVGHEAFLATGMFVPLRDDQMRVGLSVFGSTGLGRAMNFWTKAENDVSMTFSRRNTPFEWLAEARFALDKRKAFWAGGGAGTRFTAGYGAPDLRVLAFINFAVPIKDTEPKAPGWHYTADKKRIEDTKQVDTDKDGIPDDLDLCPTVPEDNQPPDPSDGCPAPSDRDHDGIPDESDKCPDQPEDKDGIDDLDGCPENDFDQDGVPDAVDACPREPGQPSPDPKKNGCPQFIRRVEGSTEIQILKRVEFATASAQILPKSFPILDEVTKLLQANKDIERVSVEGHTDSHGAHDMNMTLSQSRSESVMKYLTTHGVEAARLEAHGYGPDKPIDTNDTDEGRQRNRRVEFHIVKSK